MNLNTLRTNLQSQINVAIKDNMSVDGTRELLIGEMEHQIERLRIIESIPLSVDQLAMIHANKTMDLVDLWTNLVEHYDKSKYNIYPLVEFVEQLRFQDAKSEECILARLLALAEMVDEQTETGWQKTKRVFGLGEQTWVEKVNQVWSDDAGDRTMQDGEMAKA